MESAPLSPPRRPNSPDADIDSELVLDDDLANNEYPKALDNDNREHPERKSLMANTVTPQLFQKLKDLTTKSGWTLARAINTGVRNPESFVGCHAGDLESYTLFADLFNPVIEGYHTGFKVKSSVHVTDMDVSKIAVELSPSSKANILSVRERIVRNLAMFPLNPVGTAESRIAVADLMEKVCANFPADLRGDFYRHTEMTSQQKQLLIDDKFFFHGNDRMQVASGYHQYWPQGRAVFVSSNSDTCMWINEGDHLRIVCTQQDHADPKRVFTRLARYVAAVEDGVRKCANVPEDADVFLMHPTLGHVTCCPSNLGTGLRTSVNMMLPKLLGSMNFNQIDEIVRGMDCQARASSEAGSEVVHSINISNSRSLGVSEWKLLQDLINCVNALAEHEDALSTKDEFTESSLLFASAAHEDAVLHEAEEERKSYIASRRSSRAAAHPKRGLFDANLFVVGACVAAVAVVAAVKWRSGVA